MTESAEAVDGAVESEQRRDSPEDAEQREPETAEEPAGDAGPGGFEGVAGREEAAEVGFEPIASVVERNAFNQNRIVVHGDFIGSVDGERRAAISAVDLSASVGDLSDEFVEPPSFAATMKAIEKRRLALLVGSGCGNRVVATVALHRSGLKPIIELPGALAPADLVEGVKRVCGKAGAGVVVDSVDGETLTALAGFRLRQLQSALPDSCAVVFTTRARGRAATDHELPAIEGEPPDEGEMVEALARRSDLDDEQRERCREALGLLSRPVGPAGVAQLVAHAPRTASAEELAAIVGGHSPVLDEWLAGRPEARSLAALTVAACLDGLPSSDFDLAAERLSALLEGEVEPPSEPPRFGPRERLWPEGLARHRQEQAVTYFGWQETEIVEICPPHRQDGVISYLWRSLGGDFRRPFLQWLFELPASSSNRLAFAAARAAGILFVRDPLTIERELLRSWALDGDADLRDAAGFALGIPAMTGADPSAARRLVKQWARSNSERLRAAAIAAYGGPLGIWDPSAAAASHLWETPRDMPELQSLADAALAGQFVGGGPAGRARATVVALLGAVEDRVEVLRAYEVLPLAMRALTGGGARARDSLDALLAETERDTFSALAALLADAFDNKDGRASAQRAMRNVLHATAGGRIGRDVVERLVREMKTAASKKGRLPRLGSQVKQMLKGEDRKGGALQDVARSLHETFYEQGQGGENSEDQ